MAAEIALRLRRAALIIARQAQENAAAWSEQIPPSIKVKARATGGGKAVATIATHVGPAYPNEVIRVRHPVFGPTLRNPRPGWVTNKHRPFLAPAADMKADEAAEEIARYIDDVAHDNGYQGTG